MTKFTSFVDFQITMYRGFTNRCNHPWSQKQCIIAHENGQKWQNSRVLSTSKLQCTGGSRVVKSSQEPKTVRYSSWKRPEMTKFTSFVDFQITVYRGSRVVKSSPEQKIVRYSPWKRPEMTKFTSLSTSKLSCTRGHGPLKSSAELKTANENGQKWQNSLVCRLPNYHVPGVHEPL